MAAFVLPVAWAPQLYHASWAAKAVVGLVVLGPGLVALARLARRGYRPALLAVAFVVAAGAATLASGRPAASLTGAANWGTGLLFAGLAAGSWALGVGAGRHRRRQLVTAILAAAAVNAGLGWLQARGLTPPDLGVRGRPAGLLGNPVHLGALCAASLCLVAHRFGQGALRVRWLAVGFLCAGAAQLSGGRSALVLTVAALAWAVRAIGLRRAAALAAVVVLGYVAAPAWAGQGAVTASGRSVGAESVSQVDTRLGMWQAGAGAVLDRPVLGWGPARFAEATTPRYTAALSEGGATVYEDAHNWVVEYAVTTGLVGLGLLLAWLVAAGRGARGPLAGLAALLGVFLLAEPLSLGLVPLALLALGAASPVPLAGAGVGRRWGLAAGATALVGVVVAASLVVGEAGLKEAKLDASPARYHAAAARLPAWPEVSRIGSRIESFHALHDEAHRRRALELARQATRRDPADASAWAHLGQLELVWGTTAGARAAVDHALERNPWFAGGLSTAAKVAEATGDEELGDLACGRLQSLGRTLPESCP